MNHPNILVLKGSPRQHGNSALLAERLASGAKDAGAEVDSVYLHSLDIRPCDACEICQETGEGCIIEDDMQPLYPKLRTADAIVIASPVYWFTLSAQIKLCIDRWYALESPQGSALMGKQFALLLVYGDTDPYSSGGINAIRTFQDMCRYLRASIAGILYGSSAAGGVQNQPDLLEQAYQLGKLLGKNPTHTSKSLNAP